jgi:hypothetical protein
MFANDLTDLVVRVAPGQRFARSNPLPSPNTPSNQRWWATNALVSQVKIRWSPRRPSSAGGQHAGDLAHESVIQMRSRSARRVLPLFEARFAIPSALSLAGIRHDSTPPPAPNSLRRSSRRGHGPRADSAVARIVSKSVLLHESSRGRRLGSNRSREPTSLRAVDDINPIVGAIEAIGWKPAVAVEIHAARPVGAVRERVQRRIVHAR